LKPEHVEKHLLVIGYDLDAVFFAAAGSRPGAPGCWRRPISRARSEISLRACGYRVWLPGEGRHNMQIECQNYAYEWGLDKPEIDHWIWPWRR